MATVVDGSDADTEGDAPSDGDEERVTASFRPEEYGSSFGPATAAFLLFAVEDRLQVLPWNRHIRTRPVDGARDTYVRHETRFESHDRHFPWTAARELRAAIADLPPPGPAWVVRDAG
ncbi:hypothetical protein ACFPM1_10620 [Halorubrum rubrum]|uniref:Uncharacterized protein n=1 Tax=Halorubrum rubrum TaxID=1126240 RepID=A0ABD5R2S2_9EURY|nr:hypothetical protein [Halorubrum rubrum]